MEEKTEIEVESNAEFVRKNYPDLFAFATENNISCDDMRELQRRWIAYKIERGENETSGGHGRVRLS